MSNSTAKTPAQKRSALSRSSSFQRTSHTPNSNYSGRFIPHRQATTRAAGAMTAALGSENKEPQTSAASAYKNKLAETLFCGLDTKVLAFKQKPAAPSEDYQNQLGVIYSQNKLGGTAAAPRRTTRNIPKHPERILDCPDIIDDYYLNLMSWSSTDKLAIALGGAIYLWDAASGDTQLLLDLEDVDEGVDPTHVTSVNWMPDGSHLAVGTNNNEVQLWDVARERQVRSLKGHEGRVGSLSWNPTKPYLLSSGSRDTTIMNHDIRIRDHNVGIFSRHQEEVCGLAWSPDGKQLASGGNDNLCCVWDVNTPDQLDSSSPTHVFNESVAAIKALAWCPFQKNVLTTGAGTADRHIRFYNTISGSLLNSVDTGSQVCSLVWSPHQRELISGHGFSKNQLVVWKYPSMVKVAELEGHRSRVLSCCRSPDGTIVASAGADETLRFWKVWEVREKKSSGRRRMGGHSGSRLTSSIR